MDWEKGMIHPKFSRYVKSKKMKIFNSCNSRNDRATGQSLIREEITFYFKNTWCNKGYSWRREIATNIILSKLCPLQEEMIKRNQVRNKKTF